MSKSNSSHIRSRVIIFTRYPEPGNTKTRLIPALGEQGSADLQRKMTEHIVAIVQSLATGTNISFEIRYTGGSLKKMRDWLPLEASFVEQGKGDLGARLARAFRAALQTGTHKVIAIGSDCPGLGKETLSQALTALSTADLTLGPTHDGGYYLIGLRQESPGMFQNISWGSGQVLKETLEKASEFGLSTFLLPVLADVDRPEDLAHYNLADNS